MLHQFPHPSGLPRWMRRERAHKGGRLVLHNTRLRPAANDLPRPDVLMRRIRRALRDK